MDASSILKPEEVLIANTLKNIYYISVVEDRHNDDSILLKDIITFVQESIDKQKNDFDHSSGVSFYLPSTHDLVNAFLEKYHTILSKTEDFAYSINSRFGYITDLASIVAPYFLYQAGITDENISFYIGFGLVIANIICDSLAGKKEEKNAKLNEKNIKTICQELKKQLNISTNYAEEDEVSAINKSIEEIDKIIDQTDNM